MSFSCLRPLLLIRPLIVSLLLLISLLAFGQVYGGGSSYRTCNETAFCVRQRDFADQAMNPWHVNASSFTIGMTINFNISSGLEDVPVLSAVLGFFENGIFRLQIDTTEGHPRYTEPVDDVVIESSLWPGSLVSAIPNETCYTFITDSGIIYVYLEPFSITMADSQGNPQASFNSHSMFNFEQGEVAGQETFGQWTDIQPFGNQSIAADITFYGATHLFGLSQHASTLALQSTRSNVTNNTYYTDPYRLYNVPIENYPTDSNQAMYGSTPFIMSYADGNSNSAYGILWNNPSELWVDIFSSADYANERVTHFMSESGVIDLVFFTGSNVNMVTYQYYLATGNPFFVPRFGLGFHTGRYDYTTQEDVLIANQTLDEQGFPVDSIWLNLPGTNDSQFLIWNAVNFSDPIGFQTALGGRHSFITVGNSIQNSTDYDLFTYLAGNQSYAILKQDESGFYEANSPVGEAVWPNFLNLSVAAWWRSYFTVNNDLTKISDSTFVWMNATEPDVSDGPEGTLPKDVIHSVNGASIEHRNVHNLYSHYTTRATSQAVQWRTYSNIRPLIATRSYFTASQRYSVAWTGSFAGTWEYLKVQLPMLMSMSISGMPYIGSLIGGDLGDISYELLVRWYQLGSIQPLFVSNVGEGLNRPDLWNIPEPYQTFIKNSITLRYQLLPYMYTLAQQVSQGGLPLIQPLFYQFPTNVNITNIEDQFMIGSAVMVKPITDPGVSTTNIYFPPGVIWTDFHNLTGSSFIGNGWIYNIPVTLDKMPMYVRGGSIMMLGDASVQTSIQQLNLPYTLLVLLDQSWNAVGQHYVDDGISFGYFNGEYSYTNMNVVDGIFYNSPDLAGNASNPTWTNQVDKVLVIGANPNVAPSFVKSLTFMTRLEEKERWNLSLPQKRSIL